MMQRLKGLFSESHQNHRQIPRRNQGTLGCIERSLTKDPPSHQGVFPHRDTVHLVRTRTKGENMAEDRVMFKSSAPQGLQIGQNGPKRWVDGILTSPPSIPVRKGPPLGVAQIARSPQLSMSCTNSCCSCSQNALPMERSPERL